MTPVFIVVLVLANVAIFVFAARAILRRRRKIFDLAEEVIGQSLEQVRDHQASAAPPPPQAEPAKPLDFKCEHCGATQEGPMDVSPSGDVRCAYCDKWFNVQA